MPKESIFTLSWDGVDIGVESQDIQPYKKNSIQYYFANYLLANEDFDILYDDDGSGEIADLIGIKSVSNCIHFHLFHLKYAENGQVSNSISNFYEVCGQAEKSIKWKDSERDIFRHLMARKEKKLGRKRCSRFLYGDESILEDIEKEAKWKKPIRFHLNIVQPGLSKKSASADILLLLGVVSSYVKDVINADLKVFCSE